MRVGRPRVTRVNRSEGLGGGAEDFFKFTTEVGFAGEFQLGGGGLVGVSLGNKLLGETALQVAQPSARSDAQVLAEESL